MGESDRKPGRLSALYVNTGGMRCDHRGGDTWYSFTWYHDEPTNTTTDWQVRQSKNKKYLSDFCSQICLPPSFFLSALILGRGGGWGFHLNKQASASLVGDSLTQIKKEREKERKEGENVRGAFHAPGDAILSKHAEHSSNGSSRMGRRMEGFYGYSQPALPLESPHHLPLSSLPSSSPLLWNKCQMANKQSSACGCSKWPP